LIITKIERAKKNKSKVNIFIDESFAFSTYDQLLIDFNIFKGKEIDPLWIENVKEGTKIFQIRKYLYNIFSKKRYTQQQIKDKLISRNLDKATVEKFINEFKKKGLLNDEEFLKDYTESLKMKEKFSKREIMMKLYSKFRIDPNDDSIKGLLSDYDDRKILIKIFSQEKKIDKRIIEKYLRKGFNYDDIMDVLLNLKQEG